MPRTQIAPALKFHAWSRPNGTGSPSAIFFTPATATCIRSFCLIIAVPGEFEKVKQASDEILDYCISVGGSITGEHGVGMEKNGNDGPSVSTDTLEMIARFKKLFDPGCRLNPGKVLPTGRGCMEIRQRSGDLSL